jgi:hypothetical protein
MVMAGRLVSGATVEERRRVGDMSGERLVRGIHTPYAQ